MAIEVCCVYHSYHHSTRFTQHWPFHFKYLKHLTSTHKRLTKFGTRNQSWHRFGESSVPKNSREGPKNLQHFWTTISTMYFWRTWNVLKHPQYSTHPKPLFLWWGLYDQVSKSSRPSTLHASACENWDISFSHKWPMQLLYRLGMFLPGGTFKWNSKSRLDGYKCSGNRCIAMQKNHELINAMDLATCRSQNIPNRSLAITYICSQTMQHCMWFGRQISWCRIPTYFPGSNCGKYSQIVQRSTGLRIRIPHAILSVQIQGRRTFAIGMFGGFVHPYFF
jgi:hypothetical protein